MKEVKILFRRHERIEKDAIPMTTAAWSPAEEIHRLHVAMARLREQVERLESVIVAAGIAKRQPAGWRVLETVGGKACEKTFVADAPTDFPQ